MKNICEIPDCNKPVRTRNRCGTHYAQLRRTETPSCSIESCENPQNARGWCILHYQRWQHNGDPLIVKNIGKPGDPCTQCHLNERRDNHSWCQDCLNKGSRERNASEKGPRWRRYKLTRTDIIELKKAQNNQCPICSDSFDIVEDHVDHDNLCCSKEKTRKSGTCGKCVRALLCGSCNQGLGNFKDSVDRLENAIQYLRKWE